MKNQAKNSVYERDVLIIKSHVRSYIKSKGFWMNNLTARAVNDAVIEVLEKAMIRTKLSGRKTVFPKDV